MERKESIGNIKRIVIKLGSNTVINDLGNFSKEKVSNLAKSIQKLGEEYDFTIISSGAIYLGEKSLGFKPESISQKQLAATIGQPILMRGYIDSFAEFNLKCGQGLFSYDDFFNSDKKVHTANTWKESFRNNVIQIINENDFTSIDEIKFGDNDKLAALVAKEIGADLLVFMTNVEGLYSCMVEKTLVSYVDDLTEVECYVQEFKSSNGTGGMKSKLDSAKLFGGKSVIVDGNERDILLRLLEGEKIGTFFDL